MRILTNILDYMILLDDELISESKNKIMTSKKEHKIFDKVTKIMFYGAVTLFIIIILINL